MDILKKTVIILSLILWPLNLFLNFKGLSFSRELVFKNDYQGGQLILRNIQLYPNIPLARTFQNKPRIYFNKYVGNFFALTDPNNYFFALHPVPITENLNLHKYPFLDIVFFLAGIFYIVKSKYKNLIPALFIPSLIFLSALKNFEGFDFILYFPISLLIINGIDVMESKNKKLFGFFSVTFILFAVPEILRAFIK